jgi:hypothetical protein
MAHGAPQKIDEVVWTGLWVLFSLLLALCISCLLCSLLYFVLLLQHRERARLKEQYNTRKAVVPSKRLNLNFLSALF